MEYKRCKKCGYEPVSIVDSVRHSIEGCNIVSELSKDEQSK